MTVRHVQLDGDALMAEIGAMTPQDLDALPFGAIQLANDGTIRAYNRAEEKLSGRKATEVVGKNFFRDVAPCTRVKRFEGAFQSGVERGELNEVFDFTFRFPTGTREVRIRMIHHAASMWIFVTPIG